MVWVLLVATAVLAVLVATLAVLTLRLRSRLSALEHRLAPRSASSDAKVLSEEPWESTSTTFDARPAATAATEYVITRVGEPETEEPGEPAPTVSPPVFADLLLKETVVQTASFFQGLRRALAPETRNRIRFHMRQEVKRSRKQRRTELREVRREWAARQRAAMAAEERAEGSAA